MGKGVLGVLGVPVLLLAFGLALPARAEHVHLSSTEMPPYASATLSEQGSLTDVLRRALASMGYTLEIDFQPTLSAAMKLAEKNGPCAGFFPERFSPRADRAWILSDPIGGSPLGFAQRSDSPINWRTLDNLRNRRIGVVLDGAGAGRFERRVERGEFRIEYASDDVSNLVRLGTYRLDLAAIDGYVFAYLMANDPRLAEYRGQLVMNARVIEQTSLHVAFRKDAEGRKMAKILAQGLKKIGFDPPVFSPE